MLGLVAMAKMYSLLSICARVAFFNKVAQIVTTPAAQLNNSERELLYVLQIKMWCIFFSFNIMNCLTTCIWDVGDSWCQCAHACSFRGQICSQHAHMLKLHTGHLELWTWTIKIAKSDANKKIGIKTLNCECSQCYPSDNISQW